MKCSFALFETHKIIGIPIYSLTACYGLLGREEEARAAAAEVLRIRPNFSIEKVYTPYRDKADKERTFEVLRQAGRAT